MEEEQIKVLQKVVDSFNLDQKFPNNLSVSMIHSLDKSRRIFVWLCGTYSLKAMRTIYSEAKMMVQDTLSFTNYFLDGRMMNLSISETKKKQKEMS